MRTMRSLSSRFVVALSAALALACSGAADDDLSSGSDDLSASAGATDGALACNAATSVQVSITGTNVTSVTPMDMMLVVDESGSISNSEFETQREFLRNLVAQLDELFANGGTVGITLFGTSARIVAPLSNDQQALLSTIDGIVHGKGAATCIGCGIEDAVGQVAALSSPDRDKVAIVLTDGANNCSRDGSDAVQYLTTQVNAAGAAGARLIAVGVGNGVVMSQLQQIATGASNENVFSASNSAGLSTLMQDLVAAVLEPEATQAKLVLEVSPLSCRRT